MNEKIRVLVFRPEKEAEEMWIAGTHEILTGIVGGEITMRNPINDGTVIICRNTVDGPNPVPSYVLTNNRGQVVTRFYGTFIVVGLFMKLGELDSLTDEEIRMAKQRLKPFLGMEAAGGCERCL